MYRCDILSVAALTVVSVVLAADKECTLTSDEAPWDCCQLSEEYINNMENGTRKCLDKLPDPPMVSGDSTQTTELNNYQACLQECIYTESGLFTGDKTLNKTAILKVFSTSDKEVNSVGTAAVNKCITSYLKDVDKSLDCKSGALEFEMCTSREFFLNCPTSLWKSSKECADIKAKIQKCPSLL
ncbi:hypothetical protein J6590_029143 [Homalodisca vitripennis]|nr:hypothetical protein J6590_029143 [Homalodisca vitripennis]